MSLWDHLFVLVLLLGPLALAAGARPGALREFREESEGARLAALRQSSLILLGMAALAAALWLVQGRPASGLRLDPFVAPVWAWQFVGLLIVLMAVEPLLVSFSARVARSIARSYGHLGALFPRSRRELWTALAISLAAGLGEELIYRGFLLAYLEHYLHWMAAVGVSSVAFGLAHLYQGLRGVLAIGAVGIGLGVLSVLSGSIWPAIALHAATDAATFLAGYVLVRRGLV